MLRHYVSFPETSGVSEMTRVAFDLAEHFAPRTREKHQRVTRSTTRVKKKKAARTGTRSQASNDIRMIVSRVLRNQSPESSA